MTEKINNLSYQNALLHQTLNKVQDKTKQNGDTHHQTTVHKTDAIKTVPPKVHYQQSGKANISMNAKSNLFGDDEEDEEEEDVEEGEEQEQEEKEENKNEDEKQDEKNVNGNNKKTGKRNSRPYPHLIAYEPVHLKKKQKDISYMNLQPVLHKSKKYFFFRLIYDDEDGNPSGLPFYAGNSRDKKANEKLITEIIPNSFTQLKKLLYSSESKLSVEDKKILVDLYDKYSPETYRGALAKQSPKRKSKDQKENDENTTETKKKQPVEDKKKQSTSKEDKSIVEAETKKKQPVEDKSIVEAETKKKQPVETKQETENNVEHEIIEQPKIEKQKKQQSVEKKQETEMNVEQQIIEQPKVEKQKKHSTETKHHSKTKRQGEEQEEEQVNGNNKSEENNITEEPSKKKPRKEIVSNIENRLDSSESVYLILKMTIDDCYKRNLMMLECLKKEGKLKTISEGWEWYNQLY